MRYYGSVDELENHSLCIYKGIIIYYFLKGYGNIYLLYINVGEINLKKGLFLLFLSLVLVACGNADKDSESDNEAAAAEEEEETVEEENNQEVITNEDLDNVLESFQDKTSLAVSHNADYSRIVIESESSPDVADEIEELSNEILEDIGEGHTIVVINPQDKNDLLFSVKDGEVMKDFMRENENAEKEKVSEEDEAEDVEEVEKDSTQELEGDGSLRESDIENLVYDRVKEEYTEVSVRDIRINEDLGTGEGYIVLVDLSFDRQNTASTSKEMVDMYASDLAAYIGEEMDDVNELVSFWEVPYLQEEGNVIKITTERAGEGMAFTEQWYDTNIFE